MGKVLTKAAILAADDRKREEIDVPEWGGSIFISEITGATRLDIIKKHQEAKDKGSAVQAEVLHDAMLVASICDDRGRQLFDAKELGELKGKSGVVLERILKRAMDLNGMSPGAEDAAVKPSGEVPSEGSATASA